MKIKFPNKEEREMLSEFTDMVIEEMRPMIENAVWAIMLACKGEVELDSDDEEELDDACDCKRCERYREVIPEDEELPEDDEGDEEDTVNIVIKAKDVLTPRDIERLIEGVQRIVNGLPTDKPTKKRKIRVE